MTSVSRVTSSLRPLAGLTSDALAGGVARVAPVKRGRPSSTEPTLPGVERRTSGASSMAPRANLGVLASTPLRALREAAPASVLTPPGSFTQRLTAPYPSRVEGSLLSRQAHAPTLRAARASAEALLAARSGALLLHPEARRAAA
ncbi:hypothetical protein M5C99_04200 [Acidovorax sp. NCPPB 2350]|nr:hypothetical protein M5C99_04200 [Acidovorax sp. NCPPB 2350]